MDRVMVSPGQIPLDTDILATNQNTMIALGWLGQMMVGGETIVTGLAVTQTGTPGLSVAVSSGAVAALQSLEATAYGSLGTDSDQLQKMGINFTSSTITPTVPTLTSGQSVNILVQASFSETDTVPVILNYYNATNPAVPFSGPGNNGSPQNTRRRQTVALGFVNGTPATAGSQTTPAPTSGWVSLAVIVLTFGWSVIGNGNITSLVAIPGQNEVLLTASGTFVVPTNIYQLRGTAIGGGGGGGGTTATGSGQTSAGAGGNSGSWCDFLIDVTPGQSISYTIGAGGAGGATGGGTGGNGTATTFVSSGVVRAAGGHGATGCIANSPPFVLSGTAPVNAGSGSAVVVAGAEAPGTPGISGAAANAAGGNGGSALYGGGGGGSPGSQNGMAGLTYGAGGGGASSIQSASAFIGGQGFAGAIVLKY